MSVLLLLIGCGSPCAALCQTMAERAAACGLSVSETELETCATTYEKVDETTAAACTEANDANRLEEWWTCEELAENYTNGAQ